MSNNRIRANLGRHLHGLPARLNIRIGICLAAACLWNFGMSLNRPAIAAAQVHIHNSNAIGRLTAIPRREPQTFFLTLPVGHAIPSVVHLAGDFNSWSPTATLMKPTHSGGGHSWKVTLRLTPGLHYYKFVLNANQWMPDPAADPKLAANDGNGGLNSGVRIRSAWQRMPAPKPNIVPINEIAFNSRAVNNCDVINHHALQLTLKARTGGLSRVLVLIRSAPHQWIARRMNVELSYRDCTKWGVIAAVTQPTSHYLFAVCSGKQTLYLADYNFYTSVRAAERHAYSVHMQPKVVTPDWTKRAIWYEIFPERFANGNKANDPAHHVPWRWSWFKPYRPAGEKGNFYSYVYNRFYGGDIQGIADKLGYLRRLGVNALYLTPIFESPTIHKYDPWDYRHVDDGFGIKNSLAKLHGEKIRDPKTWQWSASDKAFLKFIRQAHRQGFKVIIDVPFGHCGVGFAPFQSVLKLGKKSPYAGWFDILKWGPPVVYQGWGQVDGNMPMFRHYPGTGLAPGYCRYIDAITRRWMAPNGKVADGVDGWRLDTAPDVPHSFWIAWRKVVKKINPKAVIIGEIWTPAQAWLNKGNQFDAVMNYPFATLCTQFFAANRQPGGIGIGPGHFGAQLARMLAWYPWQVDLSQQNLIDSHDTDRFVSRLVNMNQPFNSNDRLQNGDHYSTDKPTPEDYTRFKQVVAFQMSFPGAPMIWYGDEVGMWGASDPSDRQPMLWRQLMPYDDRRLTINTSLLRFYRFAIAAHRQLAPLQTGAYAQLLAESGNDIFAFDRSIGDRHVYVILNRSELRHTVQLPVLKADRNKPLFNYLSAADFRLMIPAGRDQRSVRRPVLLLRRNAKGRTSRGASLTITLAPWQTMILARRQTGAPRASAAEGVSTAIQQ